MSVKNHCEIFQNIFFPFFRHSKLDIFGCSISMSKQELFVRGINPTLSNDQIKGYFNKFGLLDSFKRPVDRRTGRNRDFAFISFADPTVFESKNFLKSDFDFQSLTFSDHKLPQA